MRTAHVLLVALFAIPLAAPLATATASVCVQEFCATTPPGTREFCTRPPMSACVPASGDPFENCFAIHRETNVGPVYVVQSGCGTGVGWPETWCTPRELHDGHPTCVSTVIPL